MSKRFKSSQEGDVHSQGLDFSNDDSFLHIEDDYEASIPSAESSVEDEADDYKPSADESNSLDDEEGNHRPSQSVRQVANSTKVTTKSTRAPNRSRASRAGLVFPVSRVHRYLAKGNYAERISSTSSVYLAAVLEYMCAEVLELSGDVCTKDGRKKITPRHIQLAIFSDYEINALLDNVTIQGGGVLPVKLLS